MDKTLQELHDKYTDRLKELEKSFNEYREIENMQNEITYEIKYKAGPRKIINDVQGG